MDILSRQELAAPYPSLGYAAWVIGLLFLVTVFHDDAKLPWTLGGPQR